jgi:glycerate 2-kinase
VITNTTALADTPAHEHAISALTAGIEAAHPGRVIQRAVTRDGDQLSVGHERYSLDRDGDVLVLGGGKPAGAMAAALVAVLGDHVDGGLVVTETTDPHDEEPDTGPVTLRDGTHPVPSRANTEATTELLELAAQATADDFVFVVVGGGASALLCAPSLDLSLDGYQALTQQLLDSPATIDEINAVRKQLSTIKGGQLARTLGPAPAVGLLLSDVAGNDPGVIGSGPTVRDASTTPADARAVLDRYDISVPDAVTTVLESSGDDEQKDADGQIAAFERVDNHVLADGSTALDAAARACESGGYETVVLAPDIEADAGEVGHVHTAIARSCLAVDEPFEPPVALLSGGETTVTVTGDGRGGPNQTFALSGALDLADHGVGTDIVLASLDTDGIDGPTDAAGALVDGTTVLDRRRALDTLDEDDAYALLAERDALVETGPTGTNVNDLRVLLVGQPEER